MKELLERIKEKLASYKSALIAYSGGVDSTLLAVLARKTPGLRMKAIMEDSPSMPRSVRAKAIERARQLDIPLEIHPSRGFYNSEYQANPPNRCYICKKDFYSDFLEVAHREKYLYLLDGLNADDNYDYRPGTIAARELNVSSPFQELGINKIQIRALSSELGLPTAAEPAMACLASRIPYGEPITAEKLRMIDEAEEFLHFIGFRTLRVRHHQCSTGSLARIELGENEMGEISKKKDVFREIAEKFYQIGYVHCCLDLEGYRMGSLNPFVGSFLQRKERKSSSPTDD